MSRSYFLFARPSFLEGTARIFDFGGTLNSYNISATGEVADDRALNEDWRAVGDDMRKALSEYKEEQESKANVG